MIEINTKQIAHVIAQARAKQLATKSIQDKLPQIIVQYREEHPDISDSMLAQQFLQHIAEDYQTSILINNYLQKQDLNEIGYPIKTSKTHLQLAMAEEWIKEQGEDLITQIITGKFYHNLSNEIPYDALPVLQSSSSTEYWGNENPSVSSVLLFDVVASCNKVQTNLAGAATFFPFLDSSYALPDDIVPPFYPFAAASNITLFGDYQYGAQRYFKEQLLFGPEDCSTAVGKATYLTNEQIKSISTGNMVKAYSNPNNEYHYKAATLLKSDIKKGQLELIQEGDIYLVAGHTALIATKPDNNSKITTVQFNRDIDSVENKRLGGGTYDYTLSEQVKEKEVYILRPTLEPLGESCSISELLNNIDSKYFALFPDGPTYITGDSSIFLDWSTLSS